jgi:hypothetical protein
MLLKFWLVTSLLITASCDVYSPVYESIEKTASQYFVNLYDKNSTADDDLIELRNLLLQDYDKVELENKYQVIQSDFDSLRNHFVEFESEINKISKDSALVLFNRWYLHFSNTFYTYGVEKFFSSNKNKILFFSTSMSCYCTLEMCKNQLIDILKLVRSSNGEYDYLAIDAYEKDELPLKYETLFVPSVIVFNESNNPLYKIQYDEDMITKLTEHLLKKNNQKPED